MTTLHAFTTFYNIDYDTLFALKRAEFTRTVMHGGRDTGSDADDPRCAAFGTPSVGCRVVWYSAQCPSVAETPSMPGTGEP